MLQGRNESRFLAEVNSQVSSNNNDLYLTIGKELGPLLLSFHPSRVAARPKQTPYTAPAVNLRVLSYA
jgi:hypothetical protein